MKFSIGKVFRTFVIYCFCRKVGGYLLILVTIMIRFLVFVFGGDFIFIVCIVKLYWLIFFLFKLLTFISKVLYLNWKNEFSRKWFSLFSVTICMEDMLVDILEFVLFIVIVII